MSGYTKNVYEEDLQDTKKQLVKYVDDIIPLLSEEYDFDEILKLVKKYYPFEWRMLEYSCAVTPQVRQTGNRLPGLAGTAYASLLA